MSGLDLNATMDAIGVRLATIAGLRVFDYLPDSIPAPAGVVGWPDTVEYDCTYARGCDSAVFPVFIIVGKVSDRAARDRLAPYMSGDGATSVKATLQADPTLGGVIKSLRAERAVTEPITVGAVEYLAARIDVEVYA